MISKSQEETEVSVHLEEWEFGDRRNCPQYPFVENFEERSALPDLPDTGGV